MKIVSICNQKGGVGKTSTAITLSSFLAIKGHKTLLIDLDPQGNATSGLGIEKNEIEFSAYDVLLHEKPIAEVKLSTQIEGLDLLPCNINLTGAEVELVPVMGRENRLRKAVQQVSNEYTHVIIDCPPSLGILTVNALTCAQSVLIPIQCEFYALEGLSQLIKTIHIVRDNLNPNLHIEGVLMTMADARTKLTEQAISDVRNNLGNKVYDAVIPRSVKMAEAPGFGKPIMVYDKDSVVSKKYEAFVDEFLIRANNYSNAIPT